MEGYILKRVLLTSGGLTDHFQQIFWENVNKEPSEVKVIFVPSAGTESDGAREGISMCIYKIMEMGIQMQNIFTYNLKYLLSKDYCRTYSNEVDNVPKDFRLLTIDELKEYDAIIFSGGDAGLLVNEINRTGFDSVLIDAVESGLFYIGISAGSMVAAGNFQTGLRYIENNIVVHCEQGTACGEIEQDKDIYLTNEQAVWIKGDCSCVIQ